MDLPELPLTGACLCGAVKVSITARPLLTLACHCRDCQKLSAGAFTLTTMIPRAGFAYTGALIVGGLKASERRHFYCASCLNIIFSEIEGADHRVNLRTSILDAASSLPPFVEVMTQDKVPGVEVSAVHSFVRYPASLVELDKLMNAFADAVF